MTMESRESPVPSSISPKISWKDSAILRCWGREQWSSMDSMTGYSEVTNACSLMHFTTSRNLILDVMV